MSSWNKFFLFSIITIFNLFSKGFGGVAGTNKTSVMKFFGKISKRLYAVDYFSRNLRLRCLIVSSYTNLFKNKQGIIDRLCNQYYLSKCAHTTCLTIRLGVHKTACLTNLFSRHWYCLEASDLICSIYWLIVFFVVGMSTGGVFRAGYTISFFLSLAFSLLDFLGPLLIVYEYSDIFYKMFFQYSGLCFSIEMVFGQFWMS